MGNMHPDELVHIALNKITEKGYEEALSLLQKAEAESSGGKHSKASFVKGLVLSEYLQEHEKAILSFTKAEEHSPEGKYPEASYFKGLLLGKFLHEYEKAVQSLTKAEKDSLDGKYPEASFKKGMMLSKYLNEYQRAISSYTKAEEDSLDGKHPEASYIKGYVLHKDLQEYEKAIPSYTKAEKDSSEGKYPVASFYKGYALASLHKYEAAVQSLTKAETDNPEGKYPKASFYKGYVLYENLNEYEKALESYIKAEMDSSEGKYPEASLYKGGVLTELKQYHAAIESYTKAEVDSSEGKYAEASYHKGVVLTKLKQYHAAIESYTKAEKDGFEGTYVGASYNKGVLYHKHLHAYEKAIESYTKAEEDSPDAKFYNASYNKAIAYGEHLGAYQKAMQSVIKAEADSPEGKFPKASYYKGLLLANTFEQYQTAIVSFDKAIEDAETFNETKKLSYVARAKTLLEVGKIEAARNDVYTVLFEDDRFEQVISLYVDHFSTLRTKPIFENRLEYLAIQLGIESQQASLTNSAFGTHTYLRISPDQKVNEFLFLCLDERIKFDLNISHHDKLRLAYLVAFKHKMYANVFYIIDTLIDDIYEFSAYDLFFYLTAAYLIGEPVDELEYYCKLEPKNEESLFGKAFILLRNEFKKCMETQQYLDGYLLDVLPLNFMPKELFKENTVHVWIAECMNAIILKTPYEIPISTHESQGLFSGLLTVIQNDLEQANLTLDNLHWMNFKNGLINNSYDAYQIDNISKAIADDVSYLSILALLFKAYNDSEDGVVLHNIAILQAVAMICAEAKNNIPQGIVLSNSKTIMSYFSELGVYEWFGILGALGLFPKLGITLACSKITSLCIDKIHNEISLKKQLEILKAALQ